MECRSAWETEVLGEYLPQRHFCPSQNPTWPDPSLNPGCRGGKPATNLLSYDAAQLTLAHALVFSFSTSRILVKDFNTETTASNPYVVFLPFIVQTPWNTDPFLQCVICLRSLEHWDRGFEFHSRHECLYCVNLFCVCVVLCVGNGLATGWSSVQGFLPTANN
jgi:hypothetical protein